MYLFIIANCYLEHTVLFTGGYLLRITTFLSPLRYNTSAYIHPFHISRVLRGMLFPFFYAKVVRGLHLPKVRPFGLSGKSPHLCCSLRVVFSAKTLCKSRPATLFLLEKRNQHTPIFERIKKMSLWISRK